MLVEQKTNDINSPNKYGLTPLHIAVSITSDNEKQEKIVETLLSREDINVNLRTNQEITPLHLSSYNNAKITSWLLQKGAMVDLKTGSGITPLICACKAKNNDENIKLLLEAQADVNIRETTSGWQAIHFASLIGSSDTIDLLLYYGADINSKTPIFKGRVTPIILAIKYGHNRLAEHLLSDKGADLDVCGTDDIVGCINNTKNDQFGIFNALFCMLCCGCCIPCSLIFSNNMQKEIKDTMHSFSYAKNTIFPCMHPKAESFITDPGLLSRVASIKDRVITEEPTGKVQLIKNKLANILNGYMPLPQEDKYTS